MTQLVTKMTDLVLMNDPDIVVLERPIYEEESDDFGMVNLREKRFDFGIVITDKTSNKLSIPTEIGRVVAHNYDFGDHDTVQCKELFPYVNLHITPPIKKLLEFNSYCLDPTKA